MAGSLDRVRDAARRAGLDIAITKMPASTRTATEAAEACGCHVAQIVKSLVFRDAATGELVLLLVAGDRKFDAANAGRSIGRAVQRADPKMVRDLTGFAIGGVSPIGHETPIPVYMDRHLLDQPIVWAAAGRPDSVFRVAPAALFEATAANVLPSDATLPAG